MSRYGRLSEFYDKMTTDPEYAKKFMENPGQFFSDETGLSLTDEQKEDVNGYVKERWKDRLPGTKISFSTDDGKSVIEVVINLYLG